MSEKCKVVVQIPEEHRELMLELGALLRDDPTFPKRLEAFLAHERQPSVLKALEGISRRMELFELGLEELKVDVRMVMDDRHIEPAEPLTSGEGIGRRLTDAGEKEVTRLMLRGLSDSEIGRRLGVTAASIHRRRKAFDFEASVRSPG